MIPIFSAKLGEDTEKESIRHAFLVVSLASPLNTHTMPWIAMTVLLGLSGLLLIALKIVRSLEY